MTEKLPADQQRDIQATLAQQLAAIGREGVPDRLMALAVRLQRLLRQQD